ncbi:hypothetical protein CY0110_26438 [Crocosphaera chwakensis CCY0110]|uniref:Uncharacterized protein n=1 Tax=Crocosphaera chwakensis CCY0110 TaxID=391612 RepID=A3IPH2_9CHRO|nr:hypothetical protein CY0110_26438 [Crocosphaera chwakensis CCY0110]
MLIYFDAYLLRIKQWKESHYQESLKNPSPPH